MFKTLRRSTSSTYSHLRALNFTQQKMTSFTLDLDLPAHKRWRGLPDNCKDSIRYASEYVWSANFKDREDPLCQELTKATIKNFKKFTPDEYQEEMKTIADEAEVTYEDIILFNFLHDFYPMACTSIIARKADGNIIVGQNYDCEILETGIHKLFEVNYKRSGNIIGKGLHTIGQIGPIYTYIDGRYSLSSSRRDHGNQGREFLREMLEVYKTDRKIVPFNLIFRENLVDTKIQSLEEMKALVHSFPLLSHVIIIVGDNHTAYIFEKDFSTTQNEYQLGHDGKWFIVSANQDWAVRGGRQAAAEDRLSLIGQEGINSRTLIDQILTTSPCFLYQIKNNKMIYRTTSFILIDDGQIDTKNWD